MITTIWTEIRAAQGHCDEATARRDCLAHLAENYYEPVRVMMRAWGIRSEAELDDAAQDYFHVFLEKNWLDSLDRGRGTFRGFLKVSIRNFLLNRKDRQNRRPSEVPLAGEGDGSNLHGVVLPDGSSPTPEDEFNRAWARQVMANAVAAMREHCECRDLPHYWGVFERHVLDPESFGNPSVRATAEAMGRSEADVTRYLHRARALFGETVRSLVAQTVDDASDTDAVEAELADLRRYFPSR